MGFKPRIIANPLPRWMSSVVFTSFWPRDGSGKLLEETSLPYRPRPVQLQLVITPHTVAIRYKSVHTVEGLKCCTDFSDITLRQGQDAVILGRESSIVPGDIPAKYAGPVVDFGSVKGSVFDVLPRKWVLSKEHCRHVHGVHGVCVGR